jgi:tRNA pseudouridine55 synthase
MYETLVIIFWIMIILANKPKGRTSNDVVQYIKHFTKSKKCGHAGTLDPMATGLMILATDDDTKKLHDLTGKDKSYLATIDLSKVSDTRDMEYREQFTQYEYDDNGLLID